METKKIVVKNELQCCPNCDSCYAQTHNYCPDCGQKTGLGLHSVWSMIVKFFANTFNFESKLTQTAMGLCRPGFLTCEYLAIRRINYLSPIRVFIVLMFMLFLVWSMAGVDSIHVNTSIDEEGNNQVRERSFDRNDLLQAMSVDNYISQQLNELSGLIKKRNLPQEVIDEANQSLVELKNSLALKLDQKSTFTFFGPKYEILQRDIYQLSTDEIIEKYEINSLIDQLILSAMLRFTQDPRGFVKFLFGNMTWAFFLDVLLMAGFFKFFYPRTKYAVHFVYHLHVRSFIFLVILLTMGLYWLVPSGWVFGGVTLGVLIYIAISLHRVYAKHWLKTSLYFILFIPLALISFLTSTLVVLFISSLIF